MNALTRVGSGVGSIFELNQILPQKQRTRPCDWTKRLALAAPDEVRRSSRDAEVLLFYRMRREERWVVAAARRFDGDGFPITADQTDAIEEGEMVWLK